MDPSLPAKELLAKQAEWLAEARARILRLAEIAHRKSVLDLGSGYGAVTGELRRRTSGTVVALDRSIEALASLQPCVCTTARRLPFRDATFDLVFCQNVMLWIRRPEEVIAQVKRILKSRGVWVLMEPDYGGMMEYPSGVESALLWIGALNRAGADPRIGRKLPLLLLGADFRVRTELLQKLENPSLDRFAFLSDLELTAKEKTDLQRIRKTSEQLTPDGSIAHLPYFLIIAERP
jgi:SAM-dependent methyltransferase